MNTWKDNFDEDRDLKIYYTSQYLDNLYENSRLPNLTLSDMGFKTSDLKFPEYEVTPHTN